MERQLVSVCFVDADQACRDKIIGILRKTWVKMSKKGQEMALKLPMDGRPAELVKKALEG